MRNRGAVIRNLFRGIIIAFMEPHAVVKINRYFSQVYNLTTGDPYQKWKTINVLENNAVLISITILEEMPSWSMLNCLSVETISASYVPLFYHIRYQVCCVSSFIYSYHHWNGRRSRYEHFPGFHFNQEIDWTLETELANDISPRQSAVHDHNDARRIQRHTQLHFQAWTGPCTGRLFRSTIREWPDSNKSIEQ